MLLRRPTCAVLAFMAFTGVALADPRPQAAPLQSATVQPAAPRPLLRLSRPADDRSSPYASPVKDPGPNLGHTAMERRLSGDGVTGSVGYLCGIDLYQPDSWQRGGGVDSSAGHKGAFLGAKLGYSFR